MTDPDVNPTTQFLRDRGVKTLLFVCLTHPHDDHFLGMVKLIEEFRPREFWRFGCLSPEHINKLLKYNELKAKAAIGAKKGELTRSAQELFDIFSLARNAAKNNTMGVCRLGSRSAPYPLPRNLPAPFLIECISPTGPQIERYEGAIFDCIGPDDKIARTLPHSQHNDISVVLKITYGKTKVILGGDLEEAGWREVIEQYGEANLEASAVKVSHHGSESGYCERLWEHFAQGGRPVAVIAPQHRYMLPKPGALTHIFDYARPILATCQPRIEWTMPRIPGRDGPPLESRIAVRRVLSATPAVGGTPCGRCSMHFNDKGNVRVELTDPALSLTAQNKNREAPSDV